MISSTASSPTDNRIISGSTPAARCSASSSCRCVVDAGWMTSVLASPTLARCDRNCTPSMNRSPAAAPPRTPNVRMPPAPRGRYSARERLVAIARQQRIVHPLDRRMRGQVLRHGQRRFAMPRHAQVQRLDALQQQERGQRRQRRTQRAHRLHPRLHREAEVAEGLVEAHAVIAARRLGHLRKLAVVPRKLAGLDQHAAHRGAVAAQVFGHRVDDDVGAVLERPAQVRRRQRVVDDQRNAGRVRDRRDGATGPRR